MIRSKRRVIDLRWRARSLAAGLLSLACLWDQPASAAVFPELYSVRVPMTLEVPLGGQQPTEQDYIRLAMGQLLTRVTGRSDAFLEPLLQDLVQSAARYVEQRGYLDRQTLLVRFDARAVEAALVERHQPLWGEERPLTLLWLAIDGGSGNRSMLSAEALEQQGSGELVALEQALRGELHAVAQERGLPLTLPLLDLQDMGAVTFADVWGGFSDRVRQASLRYQPDAILTGRVRVTDFGIDVQWTLLRGRGQYILPGRTLRGGLDRLADLYAGEFSTIGGASTTRVSVLGVATLDDYGRVMRHIESLSVLESVAVDELTQDNVLLLRVSARGGQSVLQRVLALSDVLTPAPVSPDAGEAPGQLIFNLVR